MTSYFLCLREERSETCLILRIVNFLFYLKDSYNFLYNIQLEIFISHNLIFFSYTTKFFLHATKIFSHSTKFFCQLLIFLYHFEMNFENEWNFDESFYFYEIFS